MSERIQEFKQAVERNNHCHAHHVASTPIVEVVNGEVVWDGVVETFVLEGCARADVCYAIPFVDNDEREIHTLLEMPWIDSPKTALQVAIAVRTGQGR